jgi:hypothetical protein
MQLLAFWAWLTSLKMVFSNLKHLIFSYVVGTALGARNLALEKEMKFLWGGLQGSFPPSLHKFTLDKGTARWTFASYCIFNTLGNCTSFKYIYVDQYVYLYFLNFYNMKILWGKYSCSKFRRYKRQYSENENKAILPPSSPCHQFTFLEVITIFRIFVGFVRDFIQALAFVFSLL